MESGEQARGVKWVVVAAVVLCVPSLCLLLGLLQGIIKKASSLVLLFKEEEIILRVWIV